MQQVELQPRPNTPFPPYGTGGGRISPQTIMIVAVTLFALSGLLVGFAVGRLNPHKQVATSGGLAPKSTQPIPPQPTTTPVKTIIKPSPIGCPGISAVTATQKSDATTVYTFSAFAKDRSHSICKNNNPLNVAGITFKLWLVQRFQDNKGIALPDGPQKIFAAVSTPITGKTLDLNTQKVSDPDIPEVSGLNFDPTTAQVQTSNAQGQVTWKYTVSASIPQGDYDLVVLSDWVGQYYNWSWTNIEIKKAGN